MFRAWLLQSSCRLALLVLTARCGADALKLAASTGWDIDFLLSNVDMPTMSGPALGQELKKVRPDIHVMLMSGGWDRRQFAGPGLWLGVRREAIYQLQTCPDGDRRCPLSGSLSARRKGIRQP